MFVSDRIDINVLENTPQGTLIASISANDADEGVNAIIEYSKDGGTDADSFQLKSRKGEPAKIFTATNLDYESDKKQYELILKASSDFRFSTTRVIIKVQDVNDNKPTLQNFTIIYNNFEASFPIEPIGRVPAFDPDVSDRDLLRYSITGNEAKLIQLNTTNGLITLDSRLNSDVPRSGAFQITVTGKKCILSLIDLNVNC